MRANYKCLRCEWKWTTRETTEFPIICPHCKSKLWNVDPDYEPPHNPSPDEAYALCIRCNQFTEDGWKTQRRGYDPVPEDFMSWQTHHPSICPKCESLLINVSKISIVNTRKRKGDLKDVAGKYSSRTV